MRRFSIGWLTAIGVLACTQAWAQHDPGQHGAEPPEAPVGEADAPAGQDAEAWLMAHSSGTSRQPASWPMPMVMFDRGGWNVSLMGQLFLVRTEQTERRGRDATYSANWAMLGAGRRVGRGAVQFRVMNSLEPATVRQRQYPLLFQTGETAFDIPIVDGQHPHDFFMELSGQYARPIGPTVLSAYYGLVGDAALGPVAFPHRASAMELPQATLGHHWQDSTHIATNVWTLGWAMGGVEIEGSAFHGAEPDERRWNIGLGAPDSWAGRVSLAPQANWTAQVSTGRLHHPEAHHPDDITRTTASAHYVRPRGNAESLAASLIWARNVKSVASYATQAVTIEALAPVGWQSAITGRFEWSQRDELFEYDHHVAEQVREDTGRVAFPVTALTLGYVRDVAAGRLFQAGLGVNATAYWISEDLTPYYGNRPWSASVFVRVRLRSDPAGMAANHVH